MIIKTFKQKNMVWYFIISFGLGWLLFVLPLAFGPAGSSTRQTVALISWSIAMWAPGLAAIVCTRLVERKPFGSLNLQRLGNWRVYVWAWLTPFFLTIAAGLLTWLLGVGKLDLEFTSIQKAMAAATGPAIPPAAHHPAADRNGIDDRTDLQHAVCVRGRAGLARISTAPDWKARTVEGDCAQRGGLGALAYASDPAGA